MNAYVGHHREIEIRKAGRKVALRVVIGEDVDYKDCEALVAAADADGSGGVDFTEFQRICNEQL